MPDGPLRRLNPPPLHQHNMPLTYPHAITQLLTLADFERKSRAHEPPDFHLRRMERLLGMLGDPHLATPVVHVAGSKGKGSTAAMIASMLSAQGMRTGLYISPHLHRFTERIQVDTLPVPDEQFAALVEQLWPDVTAIAEQGDVGRVSVFEMLTAMAFVHFRDARADMAVIEVGLGGRLDATNLVKPEVAVITPVSLDHMAVLGNTVEKIAAEKAGIIKTSSPVVVGPQQGDAWCVIRSVAAEQHAPLVDAPRQVTVAWQGAPDAGPQKLRLRGRLGDYNIALPLLGKHQVDNARTAIAAVEALAERGFRVERYAVERGLNSVAWPARAELIDCGPPAVLVDGAHNETSAHALAATIKRHFSGHSGVVMVIGATSGHDFTATARGLAELEPRIIVTESRHPKAIRAVDFAAALESDNLSVAAVARNTAEALSKARELAAPGDLIVGTGSLFVAAEVIEHVKAMTPELYPDLPGGYMQPYTTGASV